MCGTTAVDVHACVAWPKQYEPPYIYIAKQLSRKSPTSAIGSMRLICVNVNTTPLHFADSPLSQLVQACTSGVD